MTISDTYELEVPFFDVDSMHIAWHGHYCKYMELARCKLLDKIGFNYKDMSEGGYAFPIIDLRLKYVKPLTFGQKVVIEARLVEWQFRLKIQYLIHDLDTGQKLTSAYTVQAAVKLDTKAMQLECPEIFRKKVEHLL